MGIFDKIKHAIWGDDEAKADAAAQPEAIDVVTATAPTTASLQPVDSVTTASVTPAIESVAAPLDDGLQVQPAPATATAVDVAAMLDRAAAASGQKLDWRHSIVDLMKALGMDASLAERKELARELDYTGDAGDSASMNLFLHKALMKKLADNGGTVPADLLD